MSLDLLILIAAVAAVAVVVGASLLRTSGKGPAGPRDGARKSGHFKSAARAAAGRYAFYPETIA